MQESLSVPHCVPVILYSNNAPQESHIHHDNKDDEDNSGDEGN